MFRNASRGFFVVTSCALLAACGAADNSGGRPNPTTPGLASGIAGGSGISLGGVGSGTPSSTPGGFGNSTSMPPPGAGKAGGAMMMTECASALINVSRNTPTIYFVLDGSGSMCAQFGGSTRWKALRTALVDPTKGLIYRLQNAVTFGATLYDGTIDLGLALSANITNDPACALMYATMKDTGMCPQMIDVPPAPMNAAAIDMKFPMTELGGSTPTDKVMSHVMDNLVASRTMQAPDRQAQSPVYVILATDGAPNDICVGGMGGDGTMQQQGVIDAVDRGAAAGIITWVISLAGNDAQLQAHLDKVAQHGDPRNTMAHTFNPMNPDDLVKTLAALLGGAVGCNVVLQGKVKVGQECMGKVELNGMQIPCCQQAAGGWTCDKMPTTSPNGWHLVNESTVELVGDTCTNFLVSPSEMLHATFPCAVFTPS
jgi:hypothetical protein